MTNNNKLTIKENVIGIERPFLRIEKTKDGNSCDIDYEKIPQGLSEDDIMDFINQKAFGVKDKHLWVEIYHAASAALGPTTQEEYTEKNELIKRSVNEVSPKDAMETKLIAQEAVLYETAMNYMHRATLMLRSDSYGQHLWHKTFMKNAIKLFRLHTETIEALNKYRRGGKQQVIVQYQHVNVEGGAQAVVGNFNAEGGGNGKK